MFPPIVFLIAIQSDLALSETGDQNILFGETMAWIKWLFLEILNGSKWMEIGTELFLYLIFIK